MTPSDYKDKEVTIKCMDQKGIVESITHKRTDGGALGIRLMVRCDGKLYECQPHEIKLAV